MTLSRTTKRLIYLGITVLSIAWITACVLFPEQIREMIPIKQPVSIIKEKFLQCEAKKDPQLIGRCLHEFSKFAYDRFTVSEITGELNTLTYQQKDRWCHETMHYLGWRVYDRQQDIGKAFTEASELCDSGMYHGISEEYLSQQGMSDTIENTIQNICTESLAKTPEYSEGTVALCQHGLGHALMYLTSSNLQKSLDYCDNLGDKKDNCYGGVYMEYTGSYIVGPLKNAADLSDSTFCKDLKEHQKHECYKRVGANNLSLSAGETGNDVEQAMRQCLKVEEGFQHDCFLGVGSNIPAPNIPFTESGASCIKALAISEEAYKTCLQGALGFVVQLEHGAMQGFTEFCEAGDPSYKQYCYYVAGFLVKGWLKKDESYATKCGELTYEEARRSCVLGGESNEKPG